MLSQPIFFKPKFTEGQYDQNEEPTSIEYPYKDKKGTKHCHFLNFCIRSLWLY